ncbi:MAG: lycopene cyclase domain-containing protein [Acidimicrobiales bacterium]
MGEHTALAAVSVLAVIVLEHRVLRTGVFRSIPYWITLGICVAFMVPVNGWLTKLSAPIVLYAPAARTGWRFPLDIPVEDFAFGFSLLTLVVMSWMRAGASEPHEDRP